MHAHNHEEFRALIEYLKISEDDYRIGLSKVFFRSGIVARLEGELEREMAKRIIVLQALVRKFNAASRDRKKTRVTESQTFHQVAEREKLEVGLLAICVS
jgi:myosin heavy subunit